MAIDIARRKFIASLVGAGLVWPLAAHAQQARRMPKVGVLMPFRENDPESQARITALRQGFADLGWNDGQNIHIEYRWADVKIELIRQYAEELVAFAPDVIVGDSTPVIKALKKITNSIPIVFALLNDPVGQGIVNSLSHPGGNITGLTYFNPEMIGKWGALLKDVVPGTTRTALLFNPSTAPYYPNFLQEVQAVRQPGAIEIVSMPVATPAEMEKAINTLALKPGCTLIVAPDVFTSRSRSSPGKLDCRPSRATGSSLSKAGSWRTDRTPRTYSTGPPRTWTAFLRELAQPTFRCKNRSSSNSSSTSKPRSH